jgi:RNase P/RNase MRP subunit p30
MQRTMYELKVPYDTEVVENINSIDKTERLNLQKSFLELEYNRITKSKFKNKEEIKYMLQIISTVIQDVKQDIKDEGKSLKYNQIINIWTLDDESLLENFLNMEVDMLTTNYIPPRK